MQKKKGVFYVADNIIDFNTIRNHKILDELNIKEIGNINITVYSEETTNSPMYYILPDRKELTPIVNLLDATLTNNCFKVSQELKVKKI